VRRLLQSLSVYGRASAARSRVSASRNRTKWSTHVPSHAVRLLVRFCCPCPMRFQEIGGSRSFVLSKSESKGAAGCRVPFPAALFASRLLSDPGREFAAQRWPCCRGRQQAGWAAFARSVPPVLRIRFARERAAALAQRAPLRSLQRTTESRTPKIRIPARFEPRAFRRRSRATGKLPARRVRESTSSERPLGTRQPAFLLTTTTIARRLFPCCRATMPLLPSAQAPSAGPQLFSFRSRSPS
jgi:hypothetical protein